LGLSFRYNPRTDAYLVVPAAIQTIGVVANCISQEKQGINILAYVQWQIDDFSVAYRKLDFSDSREPLSIVSAQLREQTEAAIKDKIATMSVEEVLTDKEPIIEELTTRLKTVAEGRNQGDQSVDEGLGIKMVTVQIKEAVVSSARLWEDLQAPFRYEKQKAARISYLLMQDQIKQKELETRQLSETRQAETQVAIEGIKQSKQTEALETRLTEEGIRFSKEQETALARTQLDAETSARKKAFQVEQALKEAQEESRLAQAKSEAAQEEIKRTILLKKQEAELNRLVQEQRDALEQQTLQAQLARQKEETSTQLELEEASNRVKMALAENEMQIAKLQQEIRNLTNERDLTSRLIEQLPDLAAHMPAIHELKVLQTGQDGGAFEALATFMSNILALGDSLGIPLVKDKSKD
jgi:myosin heavy subunit